MARPRIAIKSNIQMTRSNGRAQASRTTSVVFVLGIAFLVAALPLLPQIDRTLDIGKLVRHSMTLGALLGLPICFCLRNPSSYFLRGERSLAFLGIVLTSSILCMDLGCAGY